MRIRLRVKLLIYSGALGMIPLGVAGWQMIRITQDELKSSANEEISTTADQLSAAIDGRYTNAWLAPLRLVANGIDNPQLGVEEKVSLARSGVEISDVVACQLSAEGVASPILISSESYALSLAEAGLDPQLILELDPGSLFALQQERGSTDPFTTELEPVPAINDWLLTIVIPLQTPISQRQGLFSARVSMSGLGTYIDERPFAKRGTLTLVDGRGLEVLGSTTDLSELSIVKDALSLLAAGAHATTTKPYTRPSGERMLAAVAFPNQFDWAVVAELEEDKAYRAVSVMRTNLLRWVLIALAVGAAGGLYFAGRISRPVEGIARIAREVGQGNLEVEVPAAKTGDEIADLATQMREMISGLRDRDFIRDTFGRYVSPEVAQQVLSDPSALHPGGEVRTVTIMFSDLRGFTSLSEQLSPAEMVELLNAYLGRMSDLVAKHGGTVIEFIGDAIMALFGAPTLSENDPLHAIACATEMHLELERFNAEYADRGIPQLQQGVGINTGSVIVGNIGSETRMKYGVVGDDVNLAARAESFTVGGEILVSEATRQAVGDAAVFRGPIEVKAKGKKEPLRLYAVVSVGAGYDLQVPAEHRADATMVEVSVPVDCFKLVGKQVAETALAGTITQLGDEQATLVIDTDLKVFDNLKLCLRPEGSEKIEDVYVKVQHASKDSGTTTCQLRFTSIPKHHRLRMMELRS